MKHVKDYLAAWGNWSVSRIGTEYKGMSYMSDESAEDRPYLTDIEGMLVDQAVGSLKRYDIDGYNIICLHYQHHISCRVIARKMKRHHSYVYAYQERAEAYLAGRLHGLLEQAA